MSQSSLNSFIGTIPAGTSFTGKKEGINGGISTVCFVNTLVNLTINVFQSTDGVTFFQTDTFVADVGLYGTQTRTQFYVKGIWGYIQLQNLGVVDAIDVVLRTIYTPNNHDGTLQQPTYVIVEGGATPLPISGIVEVSSIVAPLPAGTNALGSVVASNLITETLATRGVYYLTVGNWYRVATVGVTSGAVWNAIGAIVDGESIPAIGRLFQCLSIGTNLGGQGTCYDVEYNTNPTTVSGSVSVSNFPVTQPVSGSVAVSSIASGLNTIGGVIAQVYTGSGAVNLQVDTLTNLKVALGASVPSGTNTIGNVNILNSFYLNTFITPIVPAIPSSTWASPSADIRYYSLADVYMISAGTVTSTNGMVFQTQYSPDNVNWFDSGLTITLTSSVLQGMAVGILTASPYVRLQYIPDLLSLTDSATDVTIWIPTKAI